MTSDPHQPPSDALTPPFPTKVAVLVRDDLETWQRLNVTAFLVSGITAAHPELVGEPFADADGQAYLRLLGVPVLVVAGGRRRAAHQPEACVAALDLVGLALHGPRNAVDKVLKGTRLHP